MATVDNRFYLTGRTALSRAYLHHRYSDDLDFFVNNEKNYKEQVRYIYSVFMKSGLNIEDATFHESHTRWFVTERNCSLKIDFVNDISYRYGDVIKTPLYIRTDSMRNILSNKITALGRMETKDVIDIIYICKELPFQWKEIFNEAGKKDIWVNPVETATLLEKFPIKNINKIAWAKPIPSHDVISKRIRMLIKDIITAGNNSLVDTG